MTQPFFINDFPANINNDAGKDNPPPLTPFQQWMQQNQLKPTLLARITYVQAIYMQTADPDGTYNDPLSILRTLQETPLHDECKLDSPKGISVDWFLDVFCQTPFIQALMENGCELWFLRNVGVIEMLRHLGIWSGTFVDHVDAFAASRELVKSEKEKPLVEAKATVFISYTGRYLLRNYVEVLEELRGEYMWMDVFCVDQFAWTGQKNSKQVKAFSDKLVKDLPTQITDIGRVVLLLERWDDVPYTLHQIWVLWEVFNTVQMGIDFSILMTREEMSKYIDCICNSATDKVQKALADIRCQDATSEDSYVQQMILHQMEGSSYEVNCKVIEQVRKWYQQKGMEHVPSLIIDSADRLQYLNNFANLLSDQGKLTESEPLFREALVSFRRLLGNDHPNTLRSISNYANLLSDQGKLTESEPLYREALEARRRLLGNDHPDTLNSISNYAILLMDQGKLTESEPLYREALETRRRLLGNDHPDTLKSINNYAILLQNQGKLTEAEPLYREALEARRRLLGNDHPDTLKCITNYAILLQNQGKLTEAEPLYREALQARRQLLGSDHPDTLSSINNYANLLSDLGKLTEAEPLYREALEARRQLLGNNHPDTLSSISNYAILLRDQGKLTESELLYREALEARRWLLGNDHPDTLKSINNYAILLQNQGKLTEAEPLYREALEARRLLLGNDHPDTLKSINNYAILLQNQGKLTEAEPFYREALEAFQRLLGNDHPDTLISMYNYVILLRDQGKLTEAEPLCRETLEAFGQLLGNDHP